MKATVASAKPHGLAYSYIGIQTLYLATHFPSVFWNCACLIVKAGSSELYGQTLEELKNEEQKNKNANYGKISSAIGECKLKGIKVLSPDINKSKITFYPEISINSIIYGLKGINRIGIDLIKDIMLNRPYTSIEDFLSKVKINKLQMFSLLKSGSFDEIYNGDRQTAIDTYINIVSDKKNKLTLQNMPMLIEKNLIPKEQHQYVQLFNFNKYLKKNKQGIYYILDNRSFNFYSKHFDTDCLQDVVISQESTAKILQKDWDKIYKKEMESFKQYLTENQEQLLNIINQSDIDENRSKYLEDNFSAMEMASLGFYYHPHELSNLKTGLYHISDFKQLPEEPKVESSFQSKDGGTIKLYHLYRIAGTVIDKDKNHSTITLLTITGVVVVKIYKNSYAKWDRRIAQINTDGSKTILEDSWFIKGTKLIITGIRRGNEFVPKTYKSTKYPKFEKIISMDNEGYITCSANDRMEVD